MSFFHSFFLKKIKNKIHADTISSTAKNDKSTDMKIQKYKLRIYKHHLPRSVGRPGPGQFRDPGQRTKAPSFQKLFTFYKKRKLKSKA